MGNLARKLILILALLAAVLVVSPNVASAADDQDTESQFDKPCTQELVNAGYETTYDGKGCALTGHNWEFGGTCPGAFDASVGEWGSHQCGECLICGGGGNPGGGGGTPEPCDSPGTCFTDEEGGDFIPDSLHDFVDDCIRLGGSVNPTDLGGGVIFTECTFPNDDSYECISNNSTLLSCTHNDPDYKPAPDPTIPATPGNDELSDQTKAVDTTAGTASGGEVLVGRTVKSPTTFRIG